MRLERVPPTTIPTYTNIFDFPVPHCSNCKARMVKMPDGSWACKEHTTVIVGLAPNFELGTISPVRMAVGDAYPNRRMRRLHR